MGNAGSWLSNLSIYFNGLPRHVDLFWEEASDRQALTQEGD
jgi:hypothetical protein